MRIKVLGSRGSMPGEGITFSRYGGFTSCYLVRAGKEEIYLDAGSGIADAKPAKDTNITLLITHMHLDHLIGLPFFPALTEKNRPIDIYAAPRAGLTPEKAMDCLIAPPFWPCKIHDYPANVQIHELPTDKDFSFNIGDVNIRMTEGSHPSGSTLFRLEYGGKSLVYATDFEHSVESCKKLATFAADCDLLIYDAQYTTEEYEKYKGYGHSTPNVGIEVAKLAKVKKILFVHHAPWRTDEQLAKMESDIFAIYPESTFAKVGEEIIL